MIDRDQATAGSQLSDTPRPPSSCLVLGGSGSGKSDFAQALAARAGSSVTYLATGKAEGAEMEWRIRKHRASRPSHWRTVEALRDLARALEVEADPAPVVLLEDVGSLTANCLPWVNEKDGEQAEPGADLAAAVDALTSELDAVFDWCARRGKSLVVVSSEVGLGFLPSSPVSRLYKDAIGDVNQAFAARVDAAYLVVAGLPIDLTAASRTVMDGTRLSPVAPSSSRA
jgi:adenosylcobinamide kinase / adenosylcobinamide-phosphate guanylyltransferase